MDRIDSAGIGELVASTRLAERLGSRVKIVQGPENVREVLRISHVLPLLDAHEDEESALTSFAEEAAPTDDGAPKSD